MDTKEVFCLRYLIALIISYAISVLILPPLIDFALKKQFVDRPTQRKIHKEPTPLIGGIAIFISFFLTYAIFIRDFNSKFISILKGSLLIVGIGIIDDWYKVNKKDFPALPKLIVQLLASVIIYNAGIVFAGFTNPLNNSYVLLPEWLQFVLTLLWIFGVTTVINFSDGMDGLAGGLTSISALTLFIVALTKHQPYSAMLTIILIGSTLGFLKFNRAPAKVFVGDSGATFMGFMLAIISLDGVFKQATLISLLVPVLALGVPILDNIFVVFKRIREGKPFYLADDSQAHYRLLASGLNQKQTVSVLLLVNTCLCLVSIIITLIDI